MILNYIHFQAIHRISSKFQCEKFRLFKALKEYIGHQILILNLYILTISFNMDGATFIQNNDNEPTRFMP